MARSCPTIFCYFYRYYLAKNDRIDYVYFRAPGCDEASCYVQGNMLGCKVQSSVMPSVESVYTSVTVTLSVYVKLSLLHFLC